MPTETNPLGAYRTFGELETICRVFCEEVNDREHRKTRRRPVEALAEERARLHPLPGNPFTIALGTTRWMNWDSTVSVEGMRYSVPHTLADMAGPHGADANSHTVTVRDLPEVGE